MKLKSIYLLFIVPVSLGFVAFNRIPECYMNFKGTEKYILTASERKSSQETSYTEFYIEKDKKVRINLVDTYEGDFDHANGLSNLRISIELSENKKFKAYILARYKLMNDHHRVDHNNDQQLENFVIDSVDVYGFTAKTQAGGISGNYAMFPSDKMVIYFRFTAHENSNLKNMQEFLSERNSLIHLFLVQFAECSRN